MPAAEPKEFVPMAPRALAGFVVMLIGGALGVVLSLLYVLDSLPPAPHGEGLSRWAATAGAGIGVMLLAAVVAVLLALVANLSMEVVRIREQLGTGTGALPSSPTEPAGADQNAT